MKKNFLLIAAAVIAVPCFSQKSNKVQLKTEADTISYAYGVGLAEQGLRQYLLQSEIIVDTAEFRNSYELRIENEQDLSKKQSLSTELANKLDSINKVNTKNMEGFVKGIKQVINTTGKDKGYTEGLSIGGQMNRMLPAFEEEIFSSRQGKLDLNLFIAGVENVLKEENVLLENSNDLITQKMEESRAKIEAERLKDAEKFTEDNSREPGVVTLSSGLQYKVLQEGNGLVPTGEDRVRVHYEGRLTDGTVFDSSYERGEPAVFGVTQVIPGWTEALQLMPVGSKWILYIPFNLAYGSRDMGIIKSYSNLIFEVELLGIEE